MRAMGESLSIATADLAGVQTMLEWAAAEGWNPGLRDAEAFLVADPGGFLLGSLDGKPIAAISLVNYDDGFAFLGLYIVRPEFRGRGHGMSMWRAAMARAGTRNVGLDGVVDQQGNYARSGFRLVRRNVRYSGQGGGGSSVADDLVQIADVPADAVMRYDTGIFPAARARFLETWLRTPGARGLAGLRNGALTGYGLARPCRTGFKIGPLFADDETTAERLASGLVGLIGDDPFFLDIPEPNEAAGRLVERLGMSPVFETARMYTGEPPPEPVNRIFGVTTFELG
jgi:ribosomal protein S18 acetylase RimI-like enzyme